MVSRRGLGKGKGKGYKNIIPKDPRVHKESRMGIKQPQRIREFVARKIPNTSYFVDELDDKIKIWGGGEHTQFIEKNEFTVGFVRRKQQEYKKRKEQETKLRKQAQDIFKKNLKGKTITIIGRRWFEKANGNTYHSVEVYINGKFIGKEPFEYGYGNQFEHTAFEILQKNNLAPNFNKSTESGFQLDYSEYLDFQRENRNKFVISVTDVERKKDL